MTRPRFHLAFPVDDLEAARAFYGGLLGCAEGRSSAEWIDFDLHGHQIVAHLDAARGDHAGDDGAPRERVPTHAVDGRQVPVRHFGLILPWPEWEDLAQRLLTGGAAFQIEPYVRFAGRPGEQGTFFVSDGCGNALEFKTFRDETQIFAR